MSLRRLAAIVTASLLVAALVAVPTSLARFSSADTVEAGFGAARVAPPTDLAAVSGGTVALTWTPSASSWATGYELLRSDTPGSGYTPVGTITPVSAAAASDSPASGTWYYVLRTTFHNWSSVDSNEASVVVGTPPQTTPVADCDPAQSAAETTNAGDNNGYEVNASRACATNGAVAVDRNSGTGGPNSCVATTKDKHRFGGYALGLPPAVTSITGITVSPRVGQSNNGGTTWLCIQLSPDGGATWTAARRVTLTSNTLVTYALGGPDEAWGRAWAPADFDAAVFRVRVINSSTQSSKDFELDSVGVSVTYTP